jgi:hypothetical protein
MCCNFLFASDVVEVTPLTGNILVVHFNDGYIQHHTLGQQRTDEHVFTNPLNVVNAMLASMYTITSTNDANYSSAKNPSSVGRKSKGTDFALLCDTYNNGCYNNEPDYIQDHWVYLILPKALVTGKTYTLKLNNLAATTNTFTFVYDEKTLHSDAIHVNNLGYSTNAPKKYAYLYSWMGDKGSLDLSSFTNKSFKLYDTVSKQVVFTGTITYRKSATNSETGQTGDTPNNNFGGADVYDCDFSAFNTPGYYKIVVDGIGSSFTFALNADAYREAYYWTMKGLYQNRSGIELLSTYTDKPRPAPHNVLLTPGFAGRLKYTSTRYFDLTDADASATDKPTIEAGYKGQLTNTWGWYQDAGDWDAYYTHSNVAADLMFAYEAARNKFTDNELNIPESGNGIPDILDEASWLMRFYKRAKDEIKSKGWGTGGVPGARVMGDLWGGDVRNDGTTQGSWQDTQRDWYVSGEDPWTTFKYAALCAQMAFILRSEKLTDPQNVDWLSEAINAYAWAVANTKSGDTNEKFGVKLNHIRMYADAALYRITNTATYQADFISLLNSYVGDDNSNYLDLGFAEWLYVMMPDYRNVDAGAKTKVVTAITNAADFILSTADSRACRWGGNYYFPMLVGQASTPLVTMGIYGYLANKTSNASKANDYLTKLYTTADYFLGTNPLNMTWISGVGPRNPTGIFHMDWWYSGNKNVIKGVVPYGPWRVNNDNPLGWWSADWGFKDNNNNARIYPANIGSWPGHERWFNQRVTPIGCEFTIHQNTVLAAFVYSFLTADKQVKTIYNVDQALPSANLFLKGEMDATGNSLNWTTNQEINTDHFDVMRSADGVNFISDLNTQPAAGNSSILHQYYFTDAHALNGNNYYKIKETDKDGAVYYSNTILLKSQSNTDVTIYPNPVKGSCFVQWASSKQVKKISVFNNVGVKMIGNNQIPSGQTQAVLDMSKMPAGAYEVVVENGEGIVATKTVIVL